MGGVFEGSGGRGGGVGEGGGERVEGVGGEEEEWLGDGVGVEWGIVVKGERGEGVF